MITLRTATLEDFTDFKLHQKNLDELKAGVNIDVNTCLSFLFSVTQDKQIALIDDKPVCLLGVINNQEIWLFFSKEVDKLPLSFFKEGKKLISKYKNLSGRIYHKNTFALEWAKFMGFIIEDAKQYGVNGELFYKFHKGG